MDIRKTKKHSENISPLGKEISPEPSVVYKKKLDHQNGSAYNDDTRLEKFNTLRIKETDFKYYFFYSSEDISTPK